MQREPMGLCKAHEVGERGEAREFEPPPVLPTGVGASGAFSSRALAVLNGA